MRELCFHLRQPLQPFQATPQESQYQMSLHGLHHPRLLGPLYQLQNALVIPVKQHHARLGHNLVAKKLSKSHKMVSIQKQPFQQQKSHHAVPQYLRSKTRAGKRPFILSRPVPPGIAAVTATIVGSSAARFTSVVPKTDV